MLIGLLKLIWISVHTFTHTGSLLLGSALKQGVTFRIISFKTCKKLLERAVAHVSIPVTDR